MSQCIRMEVPLGNLNFLLWVIFIDIQKIKGDESGISRGIFAAKDALPLPCAAFATSIMSGQGFSGPTSLVWSLSS